MLANRAVGLWWGVLPHPHHHHPQFHVPKFKKRSKIGPAKYTRTDRVGTASPPPPWLPLAFSLRSRLARPRPPPNSSPPLRVKTRRTKQAKFPAQMLGDQPTGPREQALGHLLVAHAQARTPMATKEGAAPGRWRSTRQSPKPGTATLAPRAARSESRAATAGATSMRTAPRPVRTVVRIGYWRTSSSAPGTPQTMACKASSKAANSKDRVSQAASEGCRKNVRSASQPMGSCAR